MNENLAVILMAAKFGVPVCPHAGGVGLCEYVQHLSMFDFIAVTGTMEGRVIEFVDHLHEHFEEPVTMRRGRYIAPSKPGYSITIKPESRKRYRFPTAKSLEPSLSPDGESESESVGSVPTRIGRATLNGPHPQ